MTRVEKDLQKVVKLLSEVLGNAYFEGYRFDTSFTLRFGRSDFDNFKKQSLPLTIELYLLGEWWFHTEEEWAGKLSMLKSSGTFDLEEPLQAFALTHLRWCDNSEVYSVSLENEILEIRFKNEYQLRISCMPVEGESWILVGNYAQGKEDKLSVTCEGGEYYINDPQ